MKRIGIFFTIALFQAFALHSQIIHIPDQCFINALIEAGVDGNDDGEISYEEAEALEKLDIWSDCLTDLRGIEAFINLSYLACQTSNLQDLDLSSNNKLRFLNLSGKFESLDLSPLTKLDSFICIGGALRSLDVSKCVKLVFLNVLHNQLTTLNLSQNQYLVYLNCSENHLTALDLTGCQRLLKVKCADNLISSLDMSGIEYLGSLECNQNQLASMDLSSMESLEYLNCSYNLLTELDLSHNVQLSFLQCYRNQLSDLDVSRSKDLRMLHCGSNPMISLNIANNSILATNGIGLGVADLAIDHMPSLEQVCVWELPFPPPGLIMDTIGSPNIAFHTDCVVGVQSELPQKISIYPNPARDQVSVQSNWSGRKEVILSTLNGIQIQEARFEGDVYHLDISILPAGLYFITIHSPHHVATEKLIIY